MDRISCALCGLDYDPGANMKCGGCLLKSKCETICCPRCGYQTVPESALVAWARKLLSRGEAA